MFIPTHIMLKHPSKIILYAYDFIIALLYSFVNVYAFLAYDKSNDREREKDKERERYAFLAYGSFS